LGVVRVWVWAWVLTIPGSCVMAWLAFQPFKAFT